MTAFTDPSAAVDALAGTHLSAVAALRGSLAAYLRNGERPDPLARAAGLFAYPELRVRYAPDGPRHGWPAPSPACRSPGPTRSA